MALHTHLQPGDIHIIYNWEYADQLEREAATDFVASDVGKLARQKSDETLWMLLDDEDPSWAPVGGGNEVFTSEAHKALRQLIHFIDNGPAEGFASGSYREITGGVFPTAITWYNSSGGSKKKIVEKLISWTGVLPTIITWKSYDIDENLLVTITDTITYSGVFEINRTRTIT